MVLIDELKCTGCGECAADCIGNNLEISGGKARVLRECLRCGHCVAVCPEGAASIPEYGMAGVEEHEGNAPDPAALMHMIKFRRSIRRYAGRKIEREKLERVVEAGRFTATGSNRQGCRFILVEDGLAVFKEMIWDGIGAAVSAPDAASEQLLPALRRFVGLRAAGTDYLFRDAPAVLFIAADSAWDAGLAAQNMELAAVSEGLGALYNGFLRAAASMNPAALEWLDARDKPLQACMLLGYPRVTYRRTAPHRAEKRMCAGGKISGVFPAVGGEHSRIERNSVALPVEIPKYSFQRVCRDREGEGAV